MLAAGDRYRPAEGVESELIESLAEQDLRTTVAEDVRPLTLERDKPESGRLVPSAALTAIHKWRRRK